MERRTAFRAAAALAAPWFVRAWAQTGPSKAQKPTKVFRVGLLSPGDSRGTAFYLTAAYGSDITREYRQAAGFVARIFKGEKAGNLPIEQVTRLDLIVNLKVAAAIGVTIPRSLRLRADEVVE